MTETGFSFCDKLIDSAQKLGGLSASAILAIICMAMGYYLWKKLKQEEEWSRTHESSVHAEEKQTEAINRMAESLMMLRDAHNTTTTQLGHLTTILDERLPRKP